MYQDNPIRARALGIFFLLFGSCPANTAFLADFLGFSPLLIANGYVLTASSAGNFGDSGNSAGAPSISQFWPIFGVSCFG
jgi:hypothetical protein